MCFGEFNVCNPSPPSVDVRYPSLPVTLSDCDPMAVCEGERWGVNDDWSCSDPHYPTFDFNENGAMTISMESDVVFKRTNSGLDMLKKILCLRHN